MKRISDFMGEIGHYDKLTVGRWGSHCSGKPATDRITEQTEQRIIQAIADGAKRIHIGNTRAKKCRKLSTLNSRYSGFQIRTITAYF